MWAIFPNAPIQFLSQDAFEREDECGPVLTGTSRTRLSSSKTFDFDIPVPRDDRYLREEDIPTHQHAASHCVGVPTFWISQWPSR